MEPHSETVPHPSPGAGWQQDFLTRYWQFEPEEAATLGIESQGAKLRPMGPDAAAERAEFFRGAADIAHQVIRAGETVGSDTSSDQFLDALSVGRTAAIEIDSYESGESFANPHWSMYPITMLCYEELRHQNRGSSEEFEGIARERCSHLPAYLQGLQQRLQQAQASGRIVHRFWLESQVAHEIRSALPFLARFDDTAARALHDHGVWIHQHLLPSAPAEYLLGPERYHQRLELSFELGASLEDLVEEATETLEALKPRLTAEARQQFPDREIRTFSDARELLLILQQEKPSEETELSELYLKHMAHAMEGLIAAGEFESWKPAALGFAEYPEGMRDAGSGTNWPAPLVDAEAKGHFVLHPDHTAHSLAWSSVLATHEGAPGHFLQTEAWQQAFGQCKAPVRFLCIADDVAIPRQNYSAMLNVEGYAVYAEELVRANGLHEGVGKLFALAAHMLRAVRVIAEINLHRRTWSAAEAAEFIETSACLPSAKWEIERYQRGPLQALSYFIGAREIGGLRKQVQAAEGSNFKAAEFHSKLFSYGPLLPNEIASAMRAAAT